MLWDVARNGRNVVPFLKISGPAQTGLFFARGRQKLVGARVTGVDEPAWVGSLALIEVELEEVAEPKGLLPFDLLQLVEKHGSYFKAGEAIGASEAFVRQNCFKKGSS